MTIAANLFTEDFFRIARTRVRPGGVFSQWIQNYYLPPEDLRSIIAAFRGSFPHVLLFETFEGVDLLLMGSDRPLSLDIDELGRRMSELRVSMDLGRLEIRKPSDILSLYRLGSAEVDRLVEGAPRNTDDNARVEFSAPKTLGLYTLKTNLRLIRSFLGDPLGILDPLPGDVEAQDQIRIEIAWAWVYRREYDLAARIAAEITSESLRPQAEALLARLEQEKAKL